MLKQKRTTRDPFQSIDGAALAWVVGGRIAPRKGPSRQVMEGFANLAKTVAEVGQVMTVKKQQTMQQYGEMFQRIKAQRQG